jgi:hypothetical protein
MPVEERGARPSLQIRRRISAGLQADIVVCAPGAGVQAPPPLSPVRIACLNAGFGPVKLTLRNGKLWLQASEARSVAAGRA